MSGWEIVIGLEVHCELRTETKLFCSCRNAFGDEPNTNVCPVCLGLPGSLPVLNRQAVEYAIRIGTALHCTVQPSLFHRKNYFYPDMPKDYQISQYDVPINIDGWLELPSGKRIGVIRAHMEEDTGKTTHVGGGGRIHEASPFPRRLQPGRGPACRDSFRPRHAQRRRGPRLRRGAPGRADRYRALPTGKWRKVRSASTATCSVRRKGSTELGTRCEIKNMNSLRSLAHAVDYEAARQAELLADGGVVAQETRHWDEADGRTHSMRSKEEAFDYRYFPEPDLVALDPGPEWVEAVKSALGVLPGREACTGCRGCRCPCVVRGGGNRRPPPAWTASLRPLCRQRRTPPWPCAGLRTRSPASLPTAGEGTSTLTAFVRLLLMEQQGELTSAQARTVLRALVAEGGDPNAIAAKLGFQAMASGALDAVMDEVIAANPREWERYGAGDDKLDRFFHRQDQSGDGWQRRPPGRDRPPPPAARAPRPVSARPQGGPETGWGALSEPL